MKVAQSPPTMSPPAPPEPIKPIGPVNGLNLGQAAPPRRSFELPMPAQQPGDRPTPFGQPGSRLPTGPATPVAGRPGTFALPTSQAAMALPGQPGQFTAPATPNFNFPGPFGNQAPPQAAAPIPTTDPAVTVPPAAPAPPMVLNSQGVPQAMQPTPPPPVMPGLPSSAPTNPVTGRPLTSAAPTSTQPQLTQPRPEPKPVPETGLASRAVDEQTLRQTFNSETWKTLTPEQQTQAVTDVTEQLKTGNPDLYRGYQDAVAGKNTPSALRYEEHVRQQVKAMADQAAAANPEVAADPRGYGELLSGAWDTFQNMHPAMQAMVGIGLPVGLIGIMSSIFSEGGMGMAVLGALGLGAAGLGGAAGGLFGQGAQDTVNQGLFNVGSFLGMVPESQDLSVLMADDPVAAAAKGSGGGVGAFSGTSAVKKTVAEAQAKRQQLEQLLSLPPAMQRTFLMNMDRQNIRTPADADRALANARQVLAAFDDPTSAIGQQLEQARNYTDGGQTWTGRAGQIVDMVRGLGDIGAWTGAPKQSSWRPKYAFNAMDAKELHDLDEAQAQRGTYDVAQARRQHELRKRQQAMQPEKKPLLKKVVVVQCMKSARCWAGYEPVPGKKPYSNDSCRPVKKKKPAAKQPAASAKE